MEWELMEGIKEEDWHAMPQAAMEGVREKKEGGEKAMENRVKKAFKGGKRRKTMDDI